MLKKNPFKLKLSDLQDKPKDELIGLVNALPVNAELVDETSLEKIRPKRVKPKKMDLEATEHYTKMLMDMPPSKIMDFIETQTNTLMIYSKNAALEWLAEAQETNSPEALAMFLQVIQASAVLAQEKSNMQKIFGVDVAVKPRQYKAEEMTQEAWEGAYKPGQPASKEIAPSEPIYNGPTPKSVN